MKSEIKWGNSRGLEGKESRRCVATCTCLGLRNCISFILEDKKDIFGVERIFLHELRFNLCFCRKFKEILAFFLLFDHKILILRV